MEMAQRQVSVVPDKCRFFSTKIHVRILHSLPDFFFFLINTQGTGYVKITIHVNIPPTKRWQSMALTSQEVQSVSMRNSTTGTAKDDS